MNDTNKIGLGIMQLHKRGFLNRTENDADGGARGLRKFLTQVVNGGILAGAATAFRDSDRNNCSTEEDELLVDAAVMESTASMICRNGASLPASSRQLMQKQFGQSTEVILPNGNTINTTMLGSSRMSLHTNNNRLGVSESTNIIYLPGMKSHQEPDFTNVSESVVVAAQQPTIADSFLSPLFSAAARGGAAAAVYCVDYAIPRCIVPNRTGQAICYSIAIW